ncbi:piggybac transposable element-derived protein [Anaeramoeba flamelloides]|uniref:Piggybac transposable element-derived protein n=1 Tax=Anaeramoeba flamelloides TaxID=1746091 RepID=A0ABQ8XG29_9EUKA|nr:piggybac transposable element-derived protein [Anaeramoeba flamelloides]
MGIHPNTDISDHWKQNSILETKWIKDTMSRGRFQAIHRCWRFNNKTSFDQVRKIIKKKCMENWELSNQVVIDETLIKSKCRCKMIVRMPRKPQKQGLKIWVLADSDNYYYCWDLYTGESETTHKTLLKLTKHLPLEKYPKFYFKVIADAYFGSTKSVSELLDLGVNFTLMCRKDRTSQIFKNSLGKLVENGKWRSCYRDFELGTTEENSILENIDDQINLNQNKTLTFNFGNSITTSIFHKNLLLCKEIQKNNFNNEIVSSREKKETKRVVATFFKDKKRRKNGSNDVCLVSNCYDDSPIEVRRKKSPSKIKPKLCHQYSKEMDYVDKANQNIHTCLFNHRNKSWKRVLLFYFFKIIMHNTQVIYRKNNTEEHLRKTNTKETKYFLIKLAEELVGKNSTTSDRIHILKRVNHRTDCFYCRKQLKKSTSTPFHCFECKMHLHLKCFETTHWPLKHQISIKNTQFIKLNFYLCQQVSDGEFITFAVKLYYAYKMYIGVKYCGYDLFIFSIA